MTDQYTGTSAAAIQHHYDRGAEFYRLWLDPSMTYSAAMWEAAETLEEAQVAKYEHHIESAGASGAARVLDVGCGWGAGLRRLAEHHAVGHATGLTLSRDQHAVVDAMKLPNVEVRLEGWADHVVEAPYDAAISIGAFEHFARVGQSPEEKVAAYRRFFRFMHGALRPGARMSLQSIVYGSLTELDPFIQSNIWPESDLPRLGELVAAADRLFEVELLRNDRDDYAKTCAVWADRMEAQRPAVEELIGAEGYGDYVRYLRMSAKAFHVGAFGLVRVRLARIG